MKDELVLGDPDAPRFVLWNGKLRPVPAKPNDLPFFDLMSIGGKLRAGFGALGIRPPPPVCPLSIPFVYKLPFVSNASVLNLIFSYNLMLTKVTGS